MRRCTSMRRTTRIWFTVHTSSSLFSRCPEDCPPHTREAPSKARTQADIGRLCWREECRPCWSAYKCYLLARGHSSHGESHPGTKWVRRTAVTIRSDTIRRRSGDPRKWNGQRAVFVTPERRRGEYQ